MESVELFKQAIDKYHNELKDCCFKDGKLTDFGQLIIIFAIISFIYGLTSKSKEC